MSTQYIRARCLLEISDTSDYSSVSTHATSNTYTATESVLRRQITCATSATGGESVDLTNLDSANDILIENLDSTNYVTVVYRTNGGATDQTIILLAGNWVKLSDLDPATALTLAADTDAVTVRISAW